MAMLNNQRVYYEPLDFGTALLSDQLAFFLQQAGHLVIPHVPCQQFKSLNMVQ